MSNVLRPSSRLFWNLLTVNTKYAVSGRPQILSTAYNFEIVNIYSCNNVRLSSTGSGGPGGDKPPSDDNLLGTTGKLPNCKKCSNPLTPLDGPLLTSAHCKECNTLYKLTDATSGTAQILRKEEKFKLPFPKQMKSYLDRYVIGQERAKKVMSTSIYDFYKLLGVNLPNSSVSDTNSKQQRETSLQDFDMSVSYLKPELLDRSRRNENSLGVHHKQPEQDTDIRGSHILEQTKPPIKIAKSNMILLGPTGSGKTFLVQKLAQCLDVPFATQDCTSLTQAGYVGEDIEAVISKLYQDANGSIEKTQQGIVYLDEVDKLGRAKHVPQFNSRDVGGEGVQQSFLKLLEGTTVNVPVRNGSKVSPSRGETVTIDTTNILFIASGAFTGIDRIIRKRQNKGNLGFGAVKKDVVQQENNPDELMLGFEGEHVQSEEEEIEEITEQDKLLAQVSPKDLVEFGFIPEFVGRFSKIVGFHNLDQSALYNILTRVENSLLEQKEVLFQVDGVTLKFTDGAKRAIARKAWLDRTGARSLQRIVDEALEEASFEVPGSDITDVIITEDVINGTGKAVYQSDVKIAASADQ